MITILAAGSLISLFSGRPGFKHLPRRVLQRFVTVAGAGLCAALLIAASPSLHAADDGFNAYQQKVLLEPGKSVLRAEARGRVTIYDGLDESRVDQAMDEQFDRIENMMFVRTRRSAADGTVDYDDDGCD
jgi:hypothetical protein